MACSAPSLSPSQYALLELLVRFEDKVVPREEVAEAVWPDEMHITDQMIDTLVSRLRKRLAPYDADHQIVTRRGFGLIFRCITRLHNYDNPISCGCKIIRVCNNQWWRIDDYIFVIFL